MKIKLIALATLSLTSCMTTQDQQMWMQALEQQSQAQQRQAYINQQQYQYIKPIPPIQKKKSYTVMPLGRGYTIEED